MSANDKVNYRNSPYSGEDSKRPLSTYDNLNANTMTIATIDSIDSRQHDEQFTASNINEFPFGDISFRFDELQQSQNQNNTNRNIEPRPNDEWPHEYENVSGSPTPKSVHSAAKSRFLGLNHNNLSNTIVDGELQSLEDEPLLDQPGVSMIKRAHYENVPTNSTSYVMNTRNSDDECDGCDQEQGKCSKHKSNGVNHSMNSAGIDPPTSNAAMKAAKTVTLDNSDFRLNQSLSQVREFF